MNLTVSPKDGVYGVMRGELRVDDPAYESVEAHPGLRDVSIALRTGASIKSLYDHYPGDHPSLCTLHHIAERGSIENVVEDLSTRGPFVRFQVRLRGN